MKSIIRSVRTGVLFLLVCCASLIHLNAAPSAASQPPSSACAGSPYHQFDFWVGHWVVSDTGNPAVVASARIDSILDGCVLREDYQAVDGHAGRSFTIYDASRNVWHQTWVTNGGTLLEIEGKFDHGEMTLSGKNQKGEIVRGTWKPVSGEVHETALKSSDDGKTWEPWFDITFRRAPAQDQDGDTKIDGSPGDQDQDRQTLAALDAQYQEAVKRNDAASMGRILSDDFVLVTSSGKTYSKTDLLEEAKSSRVTYERQEDTDKTVRLWGDMAIVTAKLWEKGTENGTPFEYTLWFSDVYRRTPSGWRYVFAQSAYRPPESNPRIDPPLPTSSSLLSPTSGQALPDVTIFDRAQAVAGFQFLSWIESIGMCSSREEHALEDIHSCCLYLCVRPTRHLHSRFHCCAGRLRRRAFSSGCEGLL